MEGKVTKQDKFVNAMPMIALVVLIAAGLFMYFY
jgi:hypothetical protein